MLKITLVFLGGRDYKSLKYMKFAQLIVQTKIPIITRKKQK